MIAIRCYLEKAIDYPLYGKSVCKAAADGTYEKGIRQNYHGRGGRSL